MSEDCGKKNLLQAIINWIEFEMLFSEKEKQNVSQADAFPKEIARERKIGREKSYRKL